MKKQEEKKTEIKTEKKAETFADKIKELAKTAFILFCDLKKEIAIVKEKIVLIGAKNKNLLHVFSSTDGYTANYVDSVKENIGLETYWKSSRLAKGSYKIDPCHAGILFHFCEKIHKTKESFSGVKDVEKREKLILKAINCDLINLNNHIDRDLQSLITKDFPSVKLTARISLKNYLVVDDVEKGIVSYKIGK